LLSSSMLQVYRVGGPVYSRHDEVQEEVRSLLQMATSPRRVHKKLRINIGCLSVPKDNKGETEHGEGAGKKTQEKGQEGKSAAAAPHTKYVEEGDAPCRNFFAHGRDAIFDIRVVADETPTYTTQEERQ